MSTTLYPVSVSCDPSRTVVLAPSLPGWVWDRTRTVEPVSHGPALDDGGRGPLRRGTSRHRPRLPDDTRRNTFAVPTRPARPCVKTKCAHGWTVTDSPGLGPTGFKGVGSTRAVTTTGGTTADLGRPGDPSRRRGLERWHSPRRPDFPVFSHRSRVSLIHDPSSERTRKLSTPMPETRPSL